MSIEFLASAQTCQAYAVSLISNLLTPTFWGFSTVINEIGSDGQDILTSQILSFFVKVSSLGCRFHKYLYPNILCKITDYANLVFASIGFFIFLTLKETENQYCLFARD